MLLAFPFTPRLARIFFPAVKADGPTARPNCAALYKRVAVDSAAPIVNSPAPAATTPANINPKFP